MLSSCVVTKPCGVTKVSHAQVLQDEQCDNSVTPALHPLSTLVEPLVCKPALGNRPTNERMQITCGRTFERHLWLDLAVGAWIPQARGEQ